jgi:hypothetical protein
VKNRGAAKGNLMLHIVGAGRYPLNAHFCRCLAHFYRGLEKALEIAHTAWVENRIRSSP